MSEFALVDLDSQAREFARFIEGWKPSDILEWLAQHGEVKNIPDLYGGRYYIFRSVVGIRTIFTIDKNNELVLIRDHTTFKPSADPEVQ